MTLVIDSQPVPLRTDADGVVRVGKTRVTLDTVVGAFNDGGTPEEIAQQFDALTLPEIYAVITYYLRRKAEVDVYLGEGKAQAARVRVESERKHPSKGIRERLLARRRESH
ncbi:MAG: DUF433 domain-containing protein [Planctomycetes bacterium]|nr:DUF433 domain-containing protein [Planctomycetota bacterium]